MANGYCGGPLIKPIFTQGPSLGARAIALTLTALLVAVIFSFTDWFDRISDRAVDIISPLYWTTNSPSEIEQWGKNRLRDKSAILEENESLQTELLILRRKLQKMASVEAENTRLRQLLNSVDNLDDRVVVAELIGVFPDPAVHKVIINRGKENGVYKGQAVVDAHGLVGQVVRVGSFSSEVLLISDSSHAIPVQIDRNGVRLVVEGLGSVHEMALRHVSSTVDVQEGDLLVSSGLGQRFPYGYPVAKVESIVQDPGKPFLHVKLRPMAQLNRNRHVLLVFEHPTLDDLKGRSIENSDQKIELPSQTQGENL